jgi:hypothetical protein
VRPAVVEAALRRGEAREQRGIARNAGNVVLRVTQTAYIGDDLYLFFNVQNRGAQPVSVQARLLARGAALPAALTFDPPQRTLGQDRRGQGVLVVPSASIPSGARLRLEATPDLAVDGIELR